MSKTILKKLYNVLLEVEGVKKNAKNPYYKSKYSDLNTHLDLLNPILEKHGLKLIQPVMSLGMHRPALVTSIIDSEGEMLELSQFLLPELQDPQRMLAAITYYRRGALNALFSLKSEDDDGNTASGKKVQDGANKKPKEAPRKKSGEEWDF